MPLTAITVRDSKPSKTTKRLYDTGGLYLEISPSGGKWWRIKYRFGGKEKRLSLGTYPDITLKKARELRDNERLLLRDGVDPSDARKAKKVAEGGGESFEAIAREWFARFSQNWAESHSKKVMGRLEKDIFPWIGTKPISKITTPELLTMLRRIESRGAQETAYRAKMNCGQVFRYAVTTGRAEHNPANDLRGAIPRGKVRHRAALTDPKKVGDLLRAIDDYCGYYVVRYALQFAPLVFTRPSELRFAEWNEVDLASSEWRIPSHKMKMKEQHIV